MFVDFPASAFVCKRRICSAVRSNDLCSPKYYFSPSIRERNDPLILNLSLFEGDPRQLSPVTLAFVGDGVFELLVRERLLAKGSMPAGKLHALAVRQVSAIAQARAYPALEEVLNGEESDILRRGRNANTTRIPKNCAPEDYRKATAIEALFGYLYLKGETERLLQLYAVMASVSAGEE